MKKKIKFLLRHISRLTVGSLLNLFIARDNNRIMFNGSLGVYGEKKREVFLHNTKYLYLYLQNNRTDFKIGWLCDDKKMQTEFKKLGFKNVYSRTSLKGIYYSLKSKYWFYDFIPEYLPACLIQGATKIALWHGSGLMKKIGLDDEKHKQNSIIQKIYQTLTLKNDYFYIDGRPEKQAFITAFNTTPDKIKLLGFPRLDAFFQDFIHQDIFMEEDYKNITLLKEQGKKLIFYMPTFRDTHKNISAWLQSNKLREFLKQNNAVLVYKLHPLDTNSLNFELSDDFYKMNSDSDIYAVLKYADVLISDYSSISFDFLLIDRPIIYYVPDLEEYENKCRGFYEPYDEITAGSIVQTEEELFDVLLKILNNIDEFKEKRKKLRDRMFIHQKGGSCKRILDYIKELNNN